MAFVSASTSSQKGAKVRIVRPRRRAIRYNGPDTRPMKAEVAGTGHERRAADIVTGPLTRLSPAFLPLYALAYAGGVIAYTPFLMLVLPARVTELAGSDDVRWLGYIVFAGALAASAAGVASGWLSDATRRRRSWVAAGLAATVGLQLAIVWCDTVMALLWLVVAWQIALNLMLTPLIAWAGDVVPDDRKGLRAYLQQRSKTNKRLETLEFESVTGATAAFVQSVKRYVGKVSRN